MGIQMAGKEINQKRKKHMKSRVFVPDDAGIEFAEDVINIFRALCGRQTLTNIFDGRPHCPEHHQNACPSYTGLYAIPNTSWSIDDQFVGRLQPYNHALTMP